MMFRPFLLILLSMCWQEIHSQEHHQTIAPPLKINKSTLLGIWWSPEMQQSAAFQIEDSTIYYPDEFAQYRYVFRNDSLFVFRDESVTISVIARVNADTLVLSTFGHKGIFTRTEIQPAADSVTLRTVTDGVAHRHIVRKSGPWNIHSLSIDLTRPELDIVAGLALDSLLGRETASSIAVRNSNADQSVIAAINADFFNMKTGEADMNQVVEGEIVKGVQRPLRGQFGLDINRMPHVEPFIFVGAAIAHRSSIPIDGVNILPDSGVFLLNHFANQPAKRKQVSLRFIRISDDTTITIVSGQGVADSSKRINDSTYVLVGTEEAFLSGLAPQDTVRLVLGFLPRTQRIKTLVGGLPAIVRDGQIIARDSMPGMGRRFTASRHPRTGVGFSKDGKTLFFVTVDGRQESSVGMTLVEFAELLTELGCNTALNLDGGGSTTMVINGEVVNSPSDPTGERLVANVLMVVRRPPPR